MSKILVILLLSVSLGDISMTNPQTAENKEKSYKVYPLILFWTTENRLQRPVEYTIGDGPLYWYKRYNFKPVAKIQQELLFCPAIKKHENKTDKTEEDSEKGEIAAVPVDNYRLVKIVETYVIEFAKRLKLREDLSRCHSEPEPFISKIFFDTSEIQKDDEKSLKTIPCGPNDSGEKYRYGYEIFLSKEIFDKVKNNLDPNLTISKEYPNGGVINYEVYRFCFDREKKEVIYTQHKLMSPKILAHPHLYREREKHYDMSKENYGLEEFKYFTQREEEYSKYLKKKIKETSNEEDESKQSPPPKQLPYETEQLVPASDFGFALWRKPTHHYVNVELMDTDLSKLWFDVLEKIQNYATQTWLEFNVYTRAFNIPKDPTDENTEHKDIEIVLEEGNGTALKPPQIWMKIVHQYSATNSLALVIIVNNYKNEDLNPDIYKLCAIDYCKDFQSEKYPHEHRYVRCCLFNKEIQELFNLVPEKEIRGGEVDSLILVHELISISHISNDLEEMTGAKIETDIKTGDE